MIARHVLKCSVKRAKRQLTYSEFLSWVEFFRRDMKRRDKSEYYAAGIRLELVRLQRVVVGLFKKLESEEPSIENYLLQRKTPEFTAASLPTTPPVVDSGRKLKEDKAIWAAVLGMTAPDR